MGQWQITDPPLLPGSPIVNPSFELDPASWLDTFASNETSFDVAMSQTFAPSAAYGNDGMAVDEQYSGGSAFALPSSQSASFEHDYGLMSGMSSFVDMRNGEESFQEMPDVMVALGEASTSAARPTPHSRFLPKQTGILQAWFDLHSACPYPNEHDLIQLSQSTGLGREQVYRWFSNRRARLPDPSELPTGTALETYLADPIENEFADESVIRSASKSPEYQGGGTDWTMDVPTISHTRHTSCTVDDLESIGLSTSKVSFEEDEVGRARKRGRKRSLWSQAGSAVDLPSRRRRKFVPSSCTASRLGEATFFCTFCQLPLSSKTWKRHEETKHVQREQWICMRHGFTTSTPGSSNAVRCLFCNTQNPSASHAQTCARISECRARKDSDRIFNRKDHLNQHLKNFHQTAFHPDMETWRDVFAEQPWTCGFCGEILESWDARAVHVSKHFREGASINDWNVDRWSAAGQDHEPHSSATCTTANAESWEEVYIINDRGSQEASTTRVEYEIHVDDGDGAQDPFWDLPALTVAQTPVGASNPPTPAMPLVMDYAEEISSAGYLDIVRRDLQPGEPMVRDPDGPTPPISPRLMPVRSSEQAAPSPSAVFTASKMHKLRGQCTVDASASGLEDRIRLLEAQLDHYRTERDHFATLATGQSGRDSASQLRPSTPTAESMELAKTSVA